jgi:hypothetical protein
MVKRISRRRDVAGIPVLRRDNGSLSARLREALAESGLCIVVMPPRPHHADVTVQASPVFSEVTLCVRVVESAFSPHEGADALGVAELVSRALHGWQPPVAGISSALTLDAETAWTMPEEPDSKGRYTIEVNFTTSASL